jgi:hypothetical protein
MYHLDEFQASELRWSQSRETGKCDHDSRRIWNRNYHAGEDQQQFSSQFDEFQPLSL